MMWRFGWRRSSSTSNDIIEPEVEHVKAKNMVSVLVLIVVVIAIGMPAVSTGQQAYEREVVVYTSHLLDFMRPVALAFEQRYGVKTQIVAGGTGELLKRIEAEAARPLADVLAGGDVGSLEASVQYFEPYRTEQYENIIPLYRSPHDKWTAFSLLPMVVMVNTRLVPSADMPKTWKDLTDARWKGKVTLADPSRSSSAYTQVFIILTIYGEKDGWEIIRGIVRNATVLTSSGLVPRTVADGEYAVGLTLEESAVRFLRAGAPVAIVYPQEGTSTIPDGTAIVKGARNPRAARLFLDFTLNKGVQELLVKEYGRRAVRRDVAPAPGLVPIERIRLLPFDVKKAADRRDAILETFKSVMVGR